MYDLSHADVTNFPCIWFFVACMIIYFNRYISINKIINHTRDEKLENQEICKYTHTYINVKLYVELRMKFPIELPTIIYILYVYILSEVCSITIVNFSWLFAFISALNVLTKTIYFKKDISNSIHVAVFLTLLSGVQSTHIKKYFTFILRIG